MTPFIGQITLFGGTFAPRGWAFCDGQLLQVSQNDALFSILGTTYGGDGRTTFGLPDLRGRAALHKGSGPGLSNINLGHKGGAQSTTITLANLPSHNHAISATLNFRNAAGDETSPQDGSFAIAPASAQLYHADGPSAGATFNGASISATAAQTGSANPTFENHAPYQVINYIIATLGTYPSRH